jgi:hypothetical protein
MRTFLDGGQLAATNMPGHFTQIPLVSLYPVNSVPEYNESQTVAVTIASAVTYTANPSGQTIIGQPVTDIWWRYAGQTGFPSFYTEEYQYPSGYTSAVTQLPTSVCSSSYYSESVSVLYNLKYCSTSNYTWMSAIDGSAAVSGVYGSNCALSGVAPITYNLPVTGQSGITLTEGAYLLMVEAYRQNIGEHYAFDIYQFNVTW